MRSSPAPAPVPRHLIAVASARPDEAIARLAAHQFGAICRPQLLALGLSPGAIARRVERGRLWRVHRGVYAVGHEHLEFRGRVQAALLWAGPSAVASHITAAHLWRLLPSEPDGPVHVTVAVRASRRTAGVVLHRVRSLAGRQLSRRQGLPVTTVARVLLDVAETEDRKLLRRLVGEALYQRRTSVRALTQIVAASPGRRGVAALGRLLPSAGATHSGLEDRFLPLLRSAGIELPQTNVMVAGWRVDCFWPGQRVAVELDTWWSHGNPLTFDADHRKAAALRRAGIEVLRFTDEQLAGEPHAVLLTIALALRGRT